MDKVFELSDREDGESGGGQCRHDSHGRPAAPDPIPEIVGPTAGVGEVGQGCNDLQRGFADLAATIDTLREEWRQRQSWHAAEKSLTLKAKGWCRRLTDDGSVIEADKIYRAALGSGDHPRADHARVGILPLIEARNVVEGHRKASERRLIILARALPVAPFVEATRGVGLLSLAGIVGEAGDLGAYPNPGKLWKRMGAAVLDGQRQRKVGGVEAMRHGYSPRRRSVLWNVGTCIVKAGGPLKALYDVRKPYEAAKCEAIAADPIERARYARGGKYAPKLHAHNRARRYVEKRFLRLLWQEWRKGGGGQAASGDHTSSAALTTS